MKKILILLALLSVTVMANLPPTTSKIDGDASKKTTFDFEFPNFTGTHVGSKVIISGASDLPVSGDITLTGSQFNNTQVGKTLAYAGATGVAGGAILALDAITSRWDLSAQNLTFANNTVDSNLPIIKTVDCVALDSQAVTNIAVADVTYILVDDTCAVTQQTTPPTPAERRLKAFIGRINHPNRTTIQTIFSTPDYVVDNISQYYDLLDAMGPFNVYGNVISANGANLSVNRSAGAIFRRGSNYETNDQTPHEKTFSSATVANLFRATRTGTGASPFTTLDPVNYDNAGTVTAIGGVAGRSTNQRVYLLASGNLAIQYGQVIYTNLANAVDGIPNEAFVINPAIASSGILVGVISCRRDATSANNIAQCVFSNVSRFDSSGVSVGSNSVATLQSAYDNSVAPQITTTTTLGSVDLKRGSASDTDSVLRIQNGAGVSKVDIKGNGNVRTEAPISAYNLARDNNLLVNGSFEDVTYTNGWTCSLGSTTLETTAKTDGNQANAINSIGAGVRCYQTSTTNAANLKGLLGSAIVKIKTTDSIYKVCGLVDGNAAANERNCITVNPTSTDLPFYPARTDFYMGGTSNGIVVYTTTTTSQPTVIDDAFVGVFNGGLSQFSNDTGWSSCGLTTSDFTGFGTPTGIQFQCKREATNLLMRGKFVSGISTGTEARISLKFAGVALNAKTGITGSIPSGVATLTVVDPVLFGWRTLSQDGVGYLTIGRQTSTLSALTASNGSSLLGTGETLSIDASIPIAGWEANTNAAIAGCVDAFGCTNEFSSKSSSTGVISGENVEWISGNAVVTDTSLFTLTFTGLTVAPNCQVTIVEPVNTNGIYAKIETQATSSSIAIRTYYLSGASVIKLAYPFNLTCQKTGADFKPKTVVVSPLQGYVKVPGAENLNVESFSVSYGTTNAGTVCSASPCSYLDQIVNAVTSITRIGTGNYTMNTTKTYTKLKCAMSMASPIAFGGALNMSCANCSSLSFLTGSAGTTLDTYGTIMCQGIY